VINLKLYSEDIVKNLSVLRDNILYEEFYIDYIKEHENLSHLRVENSILSSVWEYIITHKKIAGGSFLAHLEVLAEEAFRNKETELYWGLVNFEDALFQQLKDDKLVSHDIIYVLRSLFGGLKPHRSILSTVNEMAYTKERKEYLWNILASSQLS
jgi:hypothetical protein